VQLSVMLSYAVPWQVELLAHLFKHMLILPAIARFLIIWSKVPL